LKLADFGFSTQLDKNGDGKLYTMLGTRGYMAPEICENKPYDGKKVDLFAAAVCLFIMKGGIPPFGEASL
jgi:serine/threonine protein kinase